MATMASHILAYGETVTYSPQSGGSLSLKALRGGNASYHEMRNEGDVLVRNTTFTVDATQSVNIMDTITDEGGTIWTIKDTSDAVQASGLVSLHCERSDLITRHRRKP